MINNISYPKLQNHKVNTGNAKIHFTGNFVQTLTHTNIGSCMDGYIGKVRLRQAISGGECFGNVFKKQIGNHRENYSILNDFGDTLGEIDIAIKKYDYGATDYDRFLYKEDPSHVFVDNLRNYTNPNTPYYKKGLVYVKDIGTRLLQIAQRRSDEAQCVGNVKLISKGESLDWYKNVIGMVQEFPNLSGSNKFRFNPNNPNALILPPFAKEPLSKLQGGL